MTLDELDEIPLSIVWDDNLESGIDLSKKAFVINTKDPKYFKRVYEKAAREFMQKCQVIIDENDQRLVSMADSQFSAGVKEGASLLNRSFKEPLPVVI